MGWTSPFKHFASDRTRRWREMNGAFAACHSSCVPGRSGRWIERDDQVVTNDEYIHGDCARGPLSSVCDEIGPDLNGSFRAVVRCPVCRGRNYK